ncbi:hypothetical protein Ct61P_03169 [Colletotrichum tofieldiae]|nr:hypothetical protein Ct61P_03169 [Colletotrichum tofieldiae]
MTTPAARQRLPLLLLPRAAPSTLRWRARHSGPENQGTLAKTAKAETAHSVRGALPRRGPLGAAPGKGQHHSDAPNTSDRDEGGGKVKVRFLTSTDTGKRDSVEYKQRVLDYKQKSRYAEREAPAKIAAILESRWRAKKDRTGAAEGESPSLFDELFSKPDPGAGASEGGVGRSQADQHLSEDRYVNHDDLQSWLNSLPKSDGSAADGDAAATTSSSSTSSPGLADRSAMLVLSNASPNLLESDFYRIGPQGHHLDGWSSSIRKVMQAYDYSTLEPMDRYFILFDSYAAAASYQKEAQRRHAAVRRSLLSPAAPLTASTSASHTEAGGSAPPIFTLAPPSRAPLSLHLYKLDRATESRLSTFSIQGLLSMTPEPPRAQTPTSSSPSTAGPSTSAC